MTRGHSSFSADRNHWSISTYWHSCFIFPYTFLPLVLYVLTFMWGKMPSYGFSKFLYFFATQSFQSFLRIAVIYKQVSTKCEQVTQSSTFVLTVYLK